MEREVRICLSTENEYRNHAESLNGAKIFIKLSGETYLEFCINSNMAITITDKALQTFTDYSQGHL